MAEVRRGQKQLQAQRFHGKRIREVTVLLDFMIHGTFWMTSGHRSDLYVMTFLNRWGNVGGIIMEGGGIACGTITCMKVIEKKT